MRDDYAILPENPPPPLAQTKYRAAQPNMADAAGHALRQARIDLWRDLWTKKEAAEHRVLELEQEVAILKARAARRSARSRRSTSG